MRTFFNEKAEGYDDVHMKMIKNKDRITELLPGDACRVLDLGAGTGLELLSLYERFPEARVTAVDISENQLKMLEKRPFADKMQLVCGDFFDTDFGSDYDAVISSAALHHFDEPEKRVLYKKIFDCLKNGGVFINSDRVLDTYEQQLDNFELFRTDPTHWRHFDTPLSLCREETLLTETGFRSFRHEVLPQGENYMLTYVRKPEKGTGEE